MALLSFVPAIAQQGAPAPAPAAAPAVKAKTKPVNDEAGIKKMFDEFSQAWAAGDAKAMASHWVKDGSLINPFGQDAWTREDVEKIVAADTQMMKGSTQTFDDYKFRFVLPGFALVDCTATVGGMKNADGTDAPVQKFHLYSAVALRDKTWYALSIRPYAFVPMPGAAAAAPAADTTLPPAVSTPSATPSLPLPADNK